MIYRFRIVSPDEDQFYREIDIRKDSSFLDFHEAIQQSADYDMTQITSFFLVEDGWKKGMEITMMDMESNSLVMSEVNLDYLIKKVKDRLIYVFDFFSDRAFYIELKEILSPEPKKKYPQCVLSKGLAPKQIMVVDVSINDILDQDLDAIYGEETRSNEDLDDYNLFTNIEDAPEPEDI